MISTYTHVPVMADRIFELLEPALRSEGSLLVDATVGLGGHAELFLSSIPGLQLLGIDQDPEAFEHSQKRLQAYGERVRLVRDRFDNLDEILEQNDLKKRPDAILFDLGVSSLQIDKPERGFSYLRDAFLDMRMSPDIEISAAQILASYSERDLALLFQRFGDERLGRRYAKAIIQRRLESPIERTSDLVEILQLATPFSKRGRGHPSKRVFQALRIAVNQELKALSNALPVAITKLAIGGRIAVMAYHSGEDRIVKNEFRRVCLSTAPLDLPSELPEHAPQFSDVTRGAEKAKAEEIAKNRRSASVRLRAIKRLREAKL